MKSANPSPARNVVSSREMLALATFATAAAAHAQQPTKPAPAASGERGRNDGDVLRDLVVSADQERIYNPEKLSTNKATAPLLDTPQTITVIPKEIYTQQNARTLTDVLKNTPGISFDAGENGFATGLANFSMRGMNTSGSIFVDGVRDSGNYLRDVFNLERVEVTKGPAADNGRGSAGGYVNLVTKTPQAADFYSGSASYNATEYGTNGNLRTTFDVNKTIPGLEGTAFRLNALFQEGGVPGRQWAEANSWGIAPSITFGLGTPTRFTLAYQHVEQNDIPDWGVPTGVQGVTGFQSAGSRGRRDNFYGLKSDYDDVKSDSILAIFEHDFANGLKLVNQSRWAHTERDARYTLPTGFVSGNPALTATQQQAYYRENENFSNLTNLSYEFQTGSIKHTLSAGLELSYETSDADKLSTPTGGNTSTTRPDPDRIVAGYPVVQGSNDVTIETAAAYLYDTIEFNDQWELTGGLRVEHYRVDIERDGAGLAGYPESRTTVGGKLGLVYKPAENGSIYASASVAALPPGSYLSNPDISRTGTTNDLPNNQPGARTQDSIHFELGTKWEFCDGRLSTSAAVFHTEKRNVPVDTPLAGAGTFSYTDQVVQGIELGVAGQITEEWSIFAGVLLLDSERKNGSSIDNNRQASDGGAVDGNELAFTPNYTANLWTTYKLPAGFTIGGGLQYVSSSYIGRPDDASRVIENGLYGKLPDYIVVNALLAYEVNENVTVRLNVDNIFDEVYAVSSNWNGARSNLGPPRTFTLSADWTF